LLGELGFLQGERFSPETLLLPQLGLLLGGLLLGLLRRLLFQRFRFCGIPACSLLLAKFLVKAALRAPLDFSRFGWPLCALCSGLFWLALGLGAGDCLFLIRSFSALSRVRRALRLLHRLASLLAQAFFFFRRGCSDSLSCLGFLADTVS